MDINKFQMPLPTAFDTKKKGRCFTEFRSRIYVSDVEPECKNQTTFWFKKEIDNSITIKHSPDEEWIDLFPNTKTSFVHDSEGKTIDELLQKIADDLELSLSEFETLLNDKLEEFERNLKTPVLINVMDHGLAGNGFTDDTIKIQELLVGGNKTLVFPKDYEFRVTDTLELDSNTTIIVDGMLIERQLTNKILFYAKDRDNIDIKIRLTGNGAKDNPVSQKYTIYFENCTNVNIHDSFIKDIDSQVAIGLRNCEDFKVNSNKIENYTYGGIMLFDNNRNGQVNFNTVLNAMNTTEVNSYAISLSSINSFSSPTEKVYGENIICDGNYINNTFAFWEGIDCHGGRNLTIINNIILGCLTGIALTTNGRRNQEIINVVVSGNVIVGGKTIIKKQVTNVGIALDSDHNKNVIITDNYIEGFGSETTSQSSGGMRILGTENVTVKDNIITECTNSGIYVQKYASDLLIAGNIITNLKSLDGVLETTGVLFEANSTKGFGNVIIKDNIFKDEYMFSKGYGIRGTRTVNSNFYTYIKATNNTYDVKNAYEIYDYMLVDSLTTVPIDLGIRIGKKGDIVYNSVGGAPIGWICTSSHVRDGAGEDRASWNTLG